MVWIRIFLCIDGQGSVGFVIVRRSIKKLFITLVNHWAIHAFICLDFLFYQREKNSALQSASSVAVDLEFQGQGHSPRSHETSVCFYTRSATKLRILKMTEQRRTHLNRVNLLSTIGKFYIYICLLSNSLTQFLVNYFAQNVYMYVCTYTYVYMYMYIYMYIYIYTRFSVDTSCICFG